jgi:hypothetical protein
VYFLELVRVTLNGFATVATAYVSLRNKNAGRITGLVRGGWG